VAVDLSGNVYVTGQRGGGANGLDLVTISTVGSAQGGCAFDGPGHADDYGAAIAVDASGNVRDGRSSGQHRAGLRHPQIRHGGDAAMVVPPQRPRTAGTKPFAIALDSAGNLT
jgi:hypothetical protein